MRRRPPHGRRAPPASSAPADDGPSAQERTSARAKVIERRISKASRRHEGREKRGRNGSYERLLVAVPLTLERPSILAQLVRGLGSLGATINCAWRSHAARITALGSGSGALN